MPSPPDKLLEKIYDLQVNQSKQLGGIDGRLGKIEDNCVICTSVTHETGRKVAIHDEQLNRHTKQLSQVIKKLDSGQATQTAFAIKTQTTWKTLVIVAGIILGAVSVAKFFLMII